MSCQIKGCIQKAFCRSEEPIPAGIAGLELLKGLKHALSTAMKRIRAVAW